MAWVANTGSTPKYRPEPAPVVLSLRSGGPAVLPMKVIE